MNEIKFIDGYHNRYAVTRCGRVYSYRNKIWLQAGLARDGYLVVTIGTRGIDRKTCKVHRLVAETFIPNRESLPVINHKDEVKTNNNLNNLEWCTQQYNVAYSTAKTYKFTYNNNQVVVHNLKQYCEKHKLHTPCMRNLFAGRLKSYKGYTQWIIAR